MPLQVFELVRSKSHMFAVRLCALDSVCGNYSERGGGVTNRGAGWFSMDPDLYLQLKRILASETQVPARREGAKACARPAASTMIAPSFSRNDICKLSSTVSLISHPHILALSCRHSNFRSSVYQATLPPMAPTKTRQLLAHCFRGLRSRWHGPSTLSP